MKTINHDSKSARTARFYDALARMGFTYAESETLRLAEKALHRWAERECNGEVERDEKTGLCYYFSNSRGERTNSRVPDRETGALKRIAAVMDARNSRTWILSGATGEYSPKIGCRETDLRAYHQTDPRGCALYLVERNKAPASTSREPHLESRWIESNYNRGFAVCI